MNAFHETRQKLLKRNFNSTCNFGTYRAKPDYSSISTFVTSPRNKTIMLFICNAPTFVRSYDQSVSKIL